MFWFDYLNWPFCDQLGELVLYFYRTRSHFLLIIIVKNDKTFEKNSALLINSIEWGLSNIINPSVKHTFFTWMQGRRKNLGKSSRTRIRTKNNALEKTFIWANFTIPTLLWADTNLPPNKPQLQVTAKVAYIESICNGFVI